MAYTVKLIKALDSDIEANVKSYLDTQTPTNIYSISSFRFGNFIFVLIVWD